jgi:hypothetical protein
MAPNLIGHFYNARKINEINRQLVQDFQPAVNKVALAGQNLIRAYENVNKAFYLYTASLYGLSHSGKNAESEAQQHAEQLQRSAEVLKKIHSEQHKWIDYLANVIAIASSTNETEKDRLKTLTSVYSKQEKQLVKAVDKGREPLAELENFYETQLTLTIDQQYQRYKFFAQCHDDLLKKHLDWSKFSVNVLEKDLLGMEIDDEEGKEYEQNHLDELYQHAEEQQKIMSESVIIHTNVLAPTNNDVDRSPSVHRYSIEEATVQPLDIYYDRLKSSSHRGNATEDGNQTNDSIFNGAVRDKQKSSVLAHGEYDQATSSPKITQRQLSQAKSSVSEVSKPSSEHGGISRPVSNISDNFNLKSDVTYENQKVITKQEDGTESPMNPSLRQAPKVFPSNIYKATPIVALLQQQQQAKRSSYADHVPSDSSLHSPVLDNRKSVNLPLAEQGVDGQELYSIYNQFKEAQHKKQQNYHAEKEDQGEFRTSTTINTTSVPLRSSAQQQSPRVEKKSYTSSAVSSSSDTGTPGVHSREKSQDAQSSRQSSSASRPPLANRICVYFFVLNYLLNCFSSTHIFCL